MDDDIIVTVANLPEGQDVAWHRDLRVIEVSSRLDCDGRRRALAIVQRAWMSEALDQLTLA